MLNRIGARDEAGAVAALADGEFHAGELREALSGITGNAGLVLSLEAMFEEPVGEGLPFGEGNIGA